MTKSIHIDHHDTAYYIPMYHRTQGINEHDMEIYKSLERRLFHEGRVIDPLYLEDQPNLHLTFVAIGFDCLLDINEKICPVFVLQFYKSVWYRIFTKGQKRSQNQAREWKEHEKVKSQSQNSTSRRRSRNRRNT
ncbi:hypothetical protein Tco_1135731 [Tanacetum coccineum]